MFRKNREVENLNVKLAHFDVKDSNEIVLRYQIIVFKTHVSLRMLLLMSY